MILITFLSKFETMKDLQQSDLKIGTKVHYIPFEGAEKSDYENGIVKSIPDHTNTFVFVVYNCNGEWDKINNYTGCSNSLINLGLGWEPEARNKKYCEIEIW